ncbi:carbon-nitrogen hydrolase family protein, partial [Variovorax sp. CT11-76]
MRVAAIQMVSAIAREANLARAHDLLARAHHAEVLGQHRELGALGGGTLPIESTDADHVFNSSLAFSPEG